MENWKSVCATSDLPPNAGVCVLMGGQQIAIFNCQRTDTLFAISNFDPIGNANVLSRGIIGSLEGQPCVASPLYKQHFNLLTGQCIEQPDQQVKVYSIRAINGQVQLLNSEAIAA